MPCLSGVVSLNSERPIEWPYVSATCPHLLLSTLKYWPPGRIACNTIERSSERPRALQVGRGSVHRRRHLERAAGGIVHDHCPAGTVVAVRAVALLPILVQRTPGWGGGGGGGGGG